MVSRAFIAAVAGPRRHARTPAARKASIATATNPHAASAASSGSFATDGGLRTSAAYAGQYPVFPYTTRELARGERLDVIPARVPGGFSIGVLIGVGISGRWLRLQRTSLRSGWGA